MSKSKLRPGDLGAPLSEKEFEELDDFLTSDQTSDETLTIMGLDGYLTALAIGPTTVPPSYWLPRVWGPNEDDAPKFETTDQAQHILGLILRDMNGIITSLEDDPDDFEPVLAFRRIGDREYLDGEAWALGFMEGLMLVRADWQALFDNEQGREWLNPLYLMGSDEILPEEQQLIATAEQREVLTKQIPASIAAIYRFWLPHRQAVHEQKLAAATQRTEPKVGRNDPCPCGSGKKFKKCCDAEDTLH
jgi:uncharacterized protein